MKLKITFISDTHGKHNQLNKDLPGGDILIHAGDFMNSGYQQTEATQFLEWFEQIDNYNTKVFIAGNHDRLFENDPEWRKMILDEFETIEYLQDEELVDYFDGPNGDIPEDIIRIYGSPWQPEFYNWAFNLPRGEKIMEKWNLIPKDVDILVTHGPAFGKLDYVPYDGKNVGCEDLLSKIQEIKPKIHLCGHIHSGYGYVFDGDTHFINAAVLNERYEFQNKPLTVDWDPKTNELEFVDNAG